MRPASPTTVSVMVPAMQKRRWAHWGKWRKRSIHTEALWKLRHARGLLILQWSRLSDAKPCSTRLRWPYRQAIHIPPICRCAGCASIDGPTGCLLGPLASASRPAVAVTPPNRAKLYGRVVPPRHSCSRPSHAGSVRERRLSKPSHMASSNCSSGTGIAPVSSHGSRHRYRTRPSA